MNIAVKFKLKLYKKQKYVIIKVGDYMESTLNSSLNEQTFEQFSDTDLAYLEENYGHLLTECQKEDLQRVKQRREKAYHDQLLEKRLMGTENHARIKSKTMVNLSRRYNGFASTLLLMFITSLFGFVSLLYIVMVNKI